MQGAWEDCLSTYLLQPGVLPCSRFATVNFENDQERNMLMQVVCQGTQSPEIRIRTASFECLHEIAAIYYSKLPAYMTELYNITVKAIKEDQEEVALQAIEFWSTVCDTEAELLEEPDDSEPCHNFIKAASPHLTPILLEQLTKQEEGLEQDDTGWNIATSAGTCLGLAARVVRNDIVPLVSRFGEGSGLNGGQEIGTLTHCVSMPYLPYFLHVHSGVAVRPGQREQEHDAGGLEAEGGLHVCIWSCP